MIPEPGLCACAEGADFDKLLIVSNNTTQIQATVLDIPPWADLSGHSHWSIEYLTYVRQYGIFNVGERLSCLAYSMESLASFISFINH